MSRMNAEKSPWKPTCGQTRQLQSQVKMSHEVCSSKCRSENYRAHLMEVFSPPRLVPAVEMEVSGLGRMISKVDMTCPRAVIESELKKT